MRSFQLLDQQPHLCKLTPREIEFLRCCVSELTYKEVADQMGIATRSVDNYRESVFEKLGIKSRVGLVLFALRNNLAEL